MLLGPQFCEQVRDPAVDRAEAMETGVAGPAEGDQSGRGVSGASMVDDKRRRREADAAGAVVALEDPFPLAGEATAVAALAVVAPLAQPAAVELRGSAGAAQRELFFEGGGHRGVPGTPLLAQLSFDHKKPTISSIIIGFFRA